MIIGAHLVTSHFGYWPPFADGRITALSYDRAARVLLLSVAYMDADKRKAAEVAFRFEGVSNVELSDLRSENIVDELTITDESPRRVTLEACYGLFGAFNCESAEVVSLLPNNAFEADRAA